MGFGHTLGFPQHFLFHGLLDLPAQDVNPNPSLKLQWFSGAQFAFS